MFSVAAFLGAAVPSASALAAVAMGALALVAIFAPGAAVALGSLRSYHGLRAHPRARTLVAGLNAGVVGLLAAACYDPLAVSAIADRYDATLALVAFCALAWRRIPSVVVVIVCAVVMRAAAAER
jgi:chromate transporter